MISKAENTPCLELAYPSLEKDSTKIVGMLAFWLRHELPFQQINERDRNVDFSIGVVIKLGRN